MIPTRTKMITSQSTSVMKRIWWSGKTKIPAQKEIKWQECTRASRSWTAAVYRVLFPYSKFYFKRYLHLILINDPWTTIKSNGFFLLATSFSQLTTHRLRRNIPDPSNPSTSPMISPSVTFFRKIPKMYPSITTNANAIYPRLLSGFFSAIRALFVG